MPWTDITRAGRRRDCQRYPSDLTDEEWTVLHPLVPPPRPGGRPRKTDMREVVNALLYIANGGIVLPVFDDPADAAAVETIARAFPDREVVTVPGAGMAEEDGCVHCATQQVPAP